MRVGLWGRCSGMLEAMDGRKQAHTDVLVAVPEQRPHSPTKSIFPFPRFTKAPRVQNTAQPNCLNILQQPAFGE